MEKNKTRSDKAQKSNNFYPKKTQNFKQTINFDLKKHVNLHLVRNPVVIVTIATKAYDLKKQKAANTD